MVGVLEPSVPYPADTEIIANIVTSPHHLGATMVTSRSHRMTELFGRLAPGVSLDAARAELTAVHAAMMREHPEAYSKKGNVQLSVKRLRDQIASPARTILLVLLAAAAVVFVIACSNVANLILARSVRREGELAVRAALGAGRGALRRTLLAESLVLCGAGAVLGVVLAQPLVAMVSRYAARFSIRALDVTVDASVLWVGAGLGDGRGGAASRTCPAPAVAARSGGPRPGERQRPDHAGHQPPAPGVRHDPDCVLVRAARRRGHAPRHGDRPASGEHRLQRCGRCWRSTSRRRRPASRRSQTVDFYQEATRRDRPRCPASRASPWASFVPWRDAGSIRSGPSFTVEGYAPADGEENPRARIRVVAPRFFAVLGVPMLAGRDFTDDDRHGSELVAIVSQSVAQRLFPNGDAVNRPCGGPIRC